jgi:uncharacterized membrane protein YsdA (DUF1294 family)
MTPLLKNPSFYIVLYVSLVNLAAFAVTGVDKRRAKRGKGKNRVPEGTLFLLAVVGGAAGEFCAMLIFRHKTKHPRFLIGIPLMAALQLCLAVYAIFFTV